MKLRQIIYPIKINIKKNNKSTEYINYLESKFSYNSVLLGRARFGIYLACLFSLKRNKKKTILISPFTILDVINCVKATGCNAEYFDIDNSLKSFYPDLKIIKKRFEKGGVNAILITHYHLNFKYIHKLREICNKFNVALIEDCAIAYGSSLPNKKFIGFFSDYAIFSNSLFKFSNYLWGGSIHIKCNDEYKEIKKILDHSPKLSLYDYLPIFIKFIKFKFLTHHYFFNYVLSKIIYIDKFLRLNIVEKFIINDPYVNFTGTIPENYFVRPNDNFSYEMYRKRNYVISSLNHRKKNFVLYSNFLSKYLVNCDYKKEFHGGFISFPIILKNSLIRNSLQRKLALCGYDVSNFLYHNVKKFEGYDSIQGNVKNLDKLLPNLLFLPTHDQIMEHDVKIISKIIIDFLE